MIYDYRRRIPQDYIRNREKQVIEPNLKQQTFWKSRFCCGFSQTTVFYSPKVLSHYKMHSISARIPLISFLYCRHSTINFTFGPQWGPGMSNCPDSSLSPPMWTLQLDCINGLISLVNDWTKTLMGVISTRLVISFNDRIIEFQSLPGPGTSIYTCFLTARNIIMARELMWLARSPTASYFKQSNGQNLISGQSSPCILNKKPSSPYLSGGGNTGHCFQLI